MKIAADILRRLAALKLPGDAFQEVLTILAEVQSADDARRERQRLKRSKYPRSRTVPRTVSGDGPQDAPRDGPGDGPHDRPPSYSLKKERKIPEANASGSSQADLERDLFKRGRQVCGKSSGGLINSLLKAKEFDVALARSVVEMASTKHDPREFVAAATRKTNGHGNPTMDACDRLLARAEDRDRERGNSARDITPSSD